MSKDRDLFQEAVKGATPLKPNNRIEPFRKLPPPHPAKREADEHAVLEELARLTLDGDDLEFEDDGLFLRPGLPRDILRKLRRTHWVIQEELDLHGLTGDEAVAETAVFLAGCKRLGIRCVRIIHGKGLQSDGSAPVLKNLVDRLLRLRNDVLAFHSAPTGQGGTGAMLVLLTRR